MNQQDMMLSGMAGFSAIIGFCLIMVKMFNHTAEMSIIMAVYSLVPIALYAQCAFKRLETPALIPHWILCLIWVVICVMSLLELPMLKD